jgi:hypothetical protein
MILGWSRLTVCPEMYRLRMRRWKSPDSIESDGGRPHLPSAPPEFRTAVAEFGAGRVESKGAMMEFVTPATELRTTVPEFRTATKESRPPASRFGTPSSGFEPSLPEFRSGYPHFRSGGGRGTKMPPIFQRVMEFIENEAFRDGWNSGGRRISPSMGATGWESAVDVKEVVPRE